MAAQGAAGASRGTGAWLGALVVAAVLTQTALNIVRPLTTYKLLAFGADAVVVGAVTAAYAVVPLAVALWLGRLSDRLTGLRWMVAVGAAVLAAGVAGTALAPGVLVVLLASAGVGLGQLLFTIAGQAAVARYSPPQALDRGFGWFTAAFSLGQLVGPLLGGALMGPGVGLDPAQRLPQVETALWIGSAASLAAVPFMLVGRWFPAVSTPREPLVRSRVEESEGRPTVAAILRTGGVASHMLASVALLTVADLLVAFLPLVAEEAGVSPLAVGVLLAARGGAAIFSRVLLPVLSRRVSRTRLLLVSLLGTAVLVALVPPTVDDLAVCSVLLVCGGFLMGLGQPLTMTLVTTAVPGSWRGSALAVRLMGNRVGQVAMPLLAGLVSAPWGPGASIWVACVLLGVSGAEKGIRAVRSS